MPSMYCEVACARREVGGLAEAADGAHHAAGEVVGSEATLLVITDAHGDRLDAEDASDLTAGHATSVETVAVLLADGAEGEAVRGVGLHVARELLASLGDDGLVEGDVLDALVGGSLGEQLERARLAGARARLDHHGGAGGEQREGLLLLVGGSEAVGLGSLGGDDDDGVAVDVLDGPAAVDLGAERAFTGGDEGAAVTALALVLVGSDVLVVVIGRQHSATDVDSCKSVSHPR